MLGFKTICFFTRLLTDNLDIGFQERQGGGLGLYDF